MPRQGRLDYTGALHHVVTRGVARGKIFFDARDYKEFISRFEHAVTATKTKCYAWSLLPNHIHLLLVTGSVSLSRFMQPLLTGYAIYFNHRHHRPGHLFQNRYKSILCEEEPYLLELVRYIHLNPLRAGLVEGLKALERYPWCGHGIVTGARKGEWQDTDFILEQFGRRVSAARSAYEAFVQEGLKLGRREELQGGGLVRSAGGVVDLVRSIRGGERLRGDERILGGSDFVSDALDEAGKLEKEQSRLRRTVDPDRVIAKAAQLAGVKPEDVKDHGKKPGQCKARRLVCKWLIDDLGLKEVEVGQLLGITQPSVSQNVTRGRELERSLKIRLERIL